LKKYPKEIRVADGNDIDFGGTEVTFSPAVPHGPTDELGYVVMTRIADGAEVFVHTSDVVGPPLKAHLSFLLDSDPTILYVDGPMTHMPEHFLASETRKALANLIRIVRSTRVRTLVIDHHLLRDRSWKTSMSPLFEAGAEHEVRIATAAEYLGKAVEQLEANRDKLYGVESTGTSETDPTEWVPRDHRGDHPASERSR